MKQSENILLTRLLAKTAVSHNRKMDNILGFYKTVLELERIKEPDITTYYPYALHFKDDARDVALIDMPCNNSFLNAFLENRRQQFPKDLYIGLAIIRKDCLKQTVLFSLTIDNDDLKDFDPYEQLLPVKISDFTLDSRRMDELELIDERIREIEHELHHIKDINNLPDLVRKYFGEYADLKMEFQLGLSSKNIALSQISAELNRLSSHMLGGYNILDQFLMHLKFDNLIQEVSVDELIPMSNLDESQEKVVAHALSNRFTVVTGAPGTGKTQVILNIIANALMKDKSVLIASKNNKAVDNVKERFDNIDSMQYLLRFGNRQLMNSQTIPALQQLVNQISLLGNQPDSYSGLLKQYDNIIEKIEQVKEKLARIEELRRKISEFSVEKSKIEFQIKQENQRHSTSLKNIKMMFSDVVHLEGVNSGFISHFRRQRNSLERKYSGLSGIWHNLFSKKKHAEECLESVENLPETINSEICRRELSRSVSDFKRGDEIIEYLGEIISLLERIDNFNRGIDAENIRHYQEISDLNSKLKAVDSEYNAVANELEELTKIKHTLLFTLQQSKQTLKNLGPQLVEAKITQILRVQGGSTIVSAYRRYIPDNIPWKSKELQQFTDLCRSFISVCRLNSVTSLSIKGALPLAENLYDLLIIDEASQCDVASALSLILRAKQVVVIGDPMQLKHITSVRAEEEAKIREHFGLSNMPYLQYAEKSLWDYAADFLSLAKQNNSQLVLENHYRCHHEIIGYSNHQFYGRQLGIKLVVKTDESKMSLPQQGVVMINIHGKQESDNVNINSIEGDRAISLAKELCSLKADVSIGIVTPFRDQADYLNSRLDNAMRGNVEVNTAHGFQGDEKDVIIYSLVVTDNSPKGKIYWIDNIVPNLVNVAVTRARQTLYVVGNADYIKSVSSEHKPLGYLIRYAQSKTK